jgi:hypothetical protein
MNSWGVRPWRGLEAARKIVGSGKLGQTPFELLMIVVVEALDGGFLDGPVHPLDLTIGPGMLHLGQAVLDAVLLAAHVEHVGDVAGGWPIGIAGWEGELDTVVGEDGVDLIWHGLDQGHKKGGGRTARRLADHLHEGEFAGPVDGDVELASGGLDLGNVDGK